ncbi:hypothetical protein QOT17_007512 [Balamuthia mandrillaris]
MNGRGSKVEFRLNATAVMQEAAKLREEDQRRELLESRILPPSCNLDPLFPPLSIREYEAMERDRGKYLLYMTALFAATAKVISQRTTMKEEDVLLRYFVLGPGLGRLISFCVEAARHFGVGFQVHALEANPRSVEFLKQRFKSEQEDGLVVLHPPCTLHAAAVSLSYQEGNQEQEAIANEELPSSLLPHLQSFDIIVAEVLGSFGDNEFLPELMHRANRLFAKSDGSAITIPSWWATYVAPIHSPSLYDTVIQQAKRLATTYKQRARNMGRKQPPTKKQKSRHGNEVENAVQAQEQHEEERDKRCTSEREEEESEEKVKEEEEAIHKRLQRFYVTALPPDAYFLAQPKMLYSFDCTVTPQTTYAGSVAFSIDSSSSLPSCHHHSNGELVVHGFVGYFRCGLFEDLHIDSIQGSSTQNTYHWESFFFPLVQPIPFPSVKDREGNDSSSPPYKTQLTTIQLQLFRQTEHLPQSPFLQRSSSSSTFSSAAASNIEKEPQKEKEREYNEEEKEELVVRRMAVWYEWQVSHRSGNVVTSNTILHNMGGKHHCLYL